MKHTKYSAVAIVLSVAGCASHQGGMSMTEQYSTAPLSSMQGMGVSRGSKEDVYGLLFSIIGDAVIEFVPWSDVFNSRSSKDDAYIDGYGDLPPNYWKLPPGRDDE